MADIVYLDKLFATRRRLETDATTTPEAARRLIELKAWQAQRLARTYEDLRRDPRCTAALDFFLTDIYGPQNFVRRDDDLLRAWGRLKRGLPDAALEVLAHALELQVLSEELDQEMVPRLAAGPITPLSYASAYRAVGRPDARQRQIDAIVSIGTNLSRLVVFPLIRLALHAAHLPAQLAGFGALQDFLERGFEAFRRVGDPHVLLDVIQARETRLMHRLFSGADNPLSIESP